MPYPLPLPLPLYPPPHAAKPKAAMRANGAARRKPFRIGVKVNMSVSFVLRVCAANLTICCRARSVEERRKDPAGQNSADMRLTAHAARPFRPSERKRPVLPDPTEFAL